MTDTLKNAHPMMPAATHDELAEQRFILSLKGFLATELNLTQKALVEAALPYLCEVNPGAIVGKEQAQVFAGKERR